MASASSRESTQRWKMLVVPVAIFLFSAWVASYTVQSFASLPKQLDITQQCRMSRMMPAYIDHTENVHAFSPSGLWRKYRLYLYRERNFDPTDVPHGSPALFVPGNAGSYGQVRSVASSSSRQFYQEGGSGDRREEWKNAPVADAHTDWYTVDFNEDFSAFSGSTLVQQATFLNEVVAYLRDRYASAATRRFPAGERNTSVPILAHSMGGVSARLMSKLESYHVGSVDTIVTLSTPHAYPPVPFDRSVEWVYAKINEAVVADDSNVPPLIVSIAGGLLDTQLPSDPASIALARFGETIPASRISSFTSSLPSLWSSVDHLAVMWCDQLREKVARGFLLDTMAFGRITEERAAGGNTGPSSELRKRRELWRRILGVSDAVDAGNGDMGPMELLQDSNNALFDEEGEPFVVPNESPSFTVDPNKLDPTSGTVAKAIYTVSASDRNGSTSAFEILTNLCVGTNPSSGTGAPIAQPLELVVKICSTGPDPGNPTAGRKAVCQAVLPWQWQLIPPSLLPRTDRMQDDKTQVELLPELRPFPFAQEIYHVPGLAFQLLRLDSTMLKRKRVDYISVERRADFGVAVHSRGLKTFVRAGWVRESHEHVERIGRDIVLTPSSEMTATTPMSYEWSIKPYGSALLARRVQVYPSQCLLDNLAAYTLLDKDATVHESDPSFAPFMHISHRATGDSRWYPQILSWQDVLSLRAKRSLEQDYLQFPLSLHADAPFMPPPRASLDEVKVRVWNDPALLRQSPSGGNNCASPIIAVRLTIDWRATAGLVLLRYRFLLAAWPLGVLIVTLGISWSRWMTDKASKFPPPLMSLLQPQVKTPFLGSRATLVGLLGSIAVGLAIVDQSRLAIYRLLYESTDHAPTSSLIGMVLGLQDAALSLMLIPIFLLVSYSAALGIAATVHGLISLSAAVLFRSGLASRLGWDSHHTGPPRWKLRSVAGIVSLLFTVVLFVPHQFVFLCMVLLQFVNTLRSRVDVIASSRGGYQAVSPTKFDTDGRYHQHLSILLILINLLPQKVSFLVTWVRNLVAVGIQTPKTSASWMDHNVLDIGPILFLVWIYAGGRILERPRTTLETRLICAAFGGAAWYAFVWGVRYTYCTYDVFNLLCLLLGVCHWRSRYYGTKEGLADISARFKAAKDSDEDSHQIEAAEAYELQEDGPVSNGLPVHHSVLPASVVAAEHGHGLQAASADAEDELESLITQYLDCLDRYQAMRSSSTKLFADGYFQLSKAKMELGHARMSSNSYDGRLLPELRVASPQAFMAGPVVERYKADYSALFPETEEGEAAGDKAAEIPDGVRRRNVSAKTKGQTRSEGKDAGTGNLHKRERVIPDALGQFVALPPPSLRGAQRLLKHALDEALGVGQEEGIGLVQIVLRLHSIEARIRDIRQKCKSAESRA